MYPLVRGSFSTAMTEGRVCSNPEIKLLENLLEKIEIFKFNKEISTARGWIYATAVTNEKWMKKTRFH